MKTFLPFLAGIFLLGYPVFGQCDVGYTYVQDVPANANILDGSNCFADDNLEVINALIIDNNLDYDHPLEVGVQSWLGNQLYIWVATFTPNGSNGINQQLQSLPENIGQLTALKQLYLEWNSLTTLPDSFTQMESLVNLAISNNWLISLPEAIGDLTELEFLDLGYNQIEAVPASISNLINLDYLWLFNNDLSEIPEGICNLPLTWNGVDLNNYPYFAIGGNALCNMNGVPECVESSDNFEISLDQFYYSFLINSPQECSECLLGDLNGDLGFNVLDIVTLANCILGANCNELENGCAADLNGDGFYNVLDIVTLANCVLAQNCADQ